MRRLGRAGLLDASSLVLALGMLSWLPGNTVLAQRWFFLGSGTATVSGRVVARDSGRPISRAEVHLARGDDHARVLLADEQGRYAFTELPAGRYTLSAGRSGYLTLNHGQQRSTDTTIDIEVSEGQSRDHVDFALPKAGVIEMRVTDEFGEPWEGVWVDIQQNRFSNSDRGPVGLAWDTDLGQRNFATDDRGRLRIYDLPPGNYFLKATFDGRGLSPIEARGGGSNSRSLRYLPTFHPGTTSPNDAKPIALALGQELSVGIPIRGTPEARVTDRPARADDDPTAVAQTQSSEPRPATGRISGRVMAADGSGPLFTAKVRLAGPEPGGYGRALATDEQGGYEFTELPAGRYTLTAERRGYLTLRYGQRPAERAAQSVEIADGQSRERVDFALPKGGVITVRVTDEFGNARAGVIVRAMQDQNANGRRRLAPARGATPEADATLRSFMYTDDRGEGRMSGCRPGTTF